MNYFAFIKSINIKRLVIRGTIVFLIVIAWGLIVNKDPFDIEHLLKWIGLTAIYGILSAITYNLLFDRKK